MKTALRVSTRTPAVAGARPPRASRAAVAAVPHAGGPAATFGRARSLSVKASAVAGES